MSQQQTLSGRILEPRDDDGICSRCGSSEDLQTHHIKYIPEEITTLCQNCHNYVHANTSSPFAPKQESNSLFSEPRDKHEAPKKASITVKEIYGNPYFYWIWREDGAVKTKYICKLSEAPDHELYTGPRVTDA